MKRYESSVAPGGVWGDVPCMGEEKDGDWYSKKEVDALLEAIHPFITHAMCTIPDDNPSYKEATKIIVYLNQILYNM